MTSPQHQLGHNHLALPNHCYYYKGAHRPYLLFLYCYSSSLGSSSQVDHSIGCDHSGRLHLPCCCHDLHDHWNNPCGLHHHRDHLFDFDMVFGERTVVPWTPHLHDYAPILHVSWLAQPELRHLLRDFLSLIHPVKHNPPNSNKFKTRVEENFRRNKCYVRAKWKHLLMFMCRSKLVIPSFVFLKIHGIFVLEKVTLINWVKTSDSWDYLAHRQTRIFSSKKVSTRKNPADIQKRLFYLKTYQPLIKIYPLK